MNRLIWYWLVVAASGFVMSCGHVSENRPVGPKWMAAPKPGEGYIVATFQTKEVVPGKGIEDSSMLVHVYAMGLTGENKTNAVLEPIVHQPRSRVSFGGQKIDYSDVIAIPVPAGKYRLTGWGARTSKQANGRSAGRNFRNDMTFDVREGKATYVGRMNFLAIYDKSLLGFNIADKAILLVTDVFPADKSRISEYYPMIPRSSIQRAPMLDKVTKTGRSTGR